jgi:hypothetical protein
MVRNGRLCRVIEVEIAVIAVATVAAVVIAAMRLWYPQYPFR